MSWFDYSQCVLEKVSFDKVLFLKELRKLLCYLSVGERIQLLRWCRQQKPWQRAGAALVPGEAGKQQGVPVSHGQNSRPNTIFP
jgi:hypothetical protein